jgi:hypothetical protein
MHAWGQQPTYGGRYKNQEGVEAYLVVVTEVVVLVPDVVVKVNVVRVVVTSQVPQVFGQAD